MQTGLHCGVAHPQEGAADVGNPGHQAAHHQRCHCPKHNTDCHIRRELTLRTHPYV